jgi:predicted regulator of Ras-like GTPase activity (Roadblock/LC7/MglB family)
MFGFFKNLLRKPHNGAQHHDIATSHAHHHAPPAANPRLNQIRRSLTHHAGNRHNGTGVELPLQRILAGLPLELQPHVVQPEVGTLTISVPLEKVLAQLSRGSVKISFGELRHAAPEVFSEEPDRDQVMVLLPLSDILTRLNPALIQRRRAQRRVEVPAEVSSPFDRFSPALGFPGTPERAEAEPPVTPPPARQVTPTVRPPQPPTGFTPHVPLPSSRGPAMPIRVPESSVRPPAPAPTSPPAKPAAPEPIPMRPQVHADGNGHSNLPPVVSAPARPLALPPLVVSLTAVADSWPEAIRKEIVELRLVDAQIALPFEKIEQALKNGRILFSWKTLRSWLKPAPQTTASPQDNTVLELPLKVVAPLFLKRQKEHAKPQQKVAIDEDIPNLFFGFPQPENPNGPSVAAATARPADTNYYVWNDTADSVRVHESEVKRGPSPGTRFAAKYATPNEIISRAGALDQVAGALIALPDGLMVASKLPADFNGETLAAFLPQIFGKVSQCTKELRMGELNNLNFTVGNVPWKIFRVNAIFFAAFGRTGEPLPTAQLAALAAELDHNPK